MHSAIIPLEARALALKQDTQETREILVTIQGYIYGAIGRDDGVSTEFGVDVTDVKIHDRQV
jgi:hypothetical protein